MIQRKTKIAIIGSKGIPSHVSGLEIYVQKISVEMAKESEVTVYCRKRYCDVIVNNYNGVKVKYIPSINTKHLDAFSYTFFAAIKAILDGNDVFWYHALGPSISMFIPHIFNKRIICTVHGLDWKRDKFGKMASLVLKYGEQCISRYSNVIITMNKNDHDHFCQRWNKESIQINNGVEQPKKYYEADVIKNKYGISKDSYYLFMSRIVPEKEVHTLIKAFNTEDIHRKLIIAGSGVHTTEYEHFVRQLANYNSNIKFIGSVDGKEKAELYSNAYAYILPSSIEGQSIGLLEAMSYGLPCIVSDIPENVDVLEDVGLFFEVKNVDSLRKTLLYAEGAYEEIHKLGKKGQDISRKEHAFDEFIKNTMKAVLGE